MGRSKDKDGNFIGIPNQNLTLDTTVYDVMFPDGSLSQYSANVIAKSIHSQVDEDRHCYQILDHISNHRKDNRALKSAEGWITAKNGQKFQKMTTKGWYFKAE